MDIEPDTGSGGVNISGSNAFTGPEIAAWANEWIAELQRDISGVQLTPILYMDQGRAKLLVGASPSLASYPLWISALNNNPSFTPTIAPWSTWGVMQWSRTGRRARDTGSVDVDVLNPATSLASLEIGTSIQTILQAYDTGANGVSNNVCSDIANQGGLGQTLPLLGTSLGDALGISGVIQTPFENSPTPNTSNFQVSSSGGGFQPDGQSSGGGIQPDSQSIDPTWNSLVNAFGSAPFPNLIGTPDAGGNNLIPSANGDLFEVTWSQIFNLPTVPLLASGTSLFGYGAGGEIVDGLTATGQVSVSLTMGVDINAQNQLGFFVLPNANAVQAKLTVPTVPAGSGSLTGSLEIGDLANVTVAGSVGVGITGALGFGIHHRYQRQDSRQRPDEKPFLGGQRRHQRIGDGQWELCRELASLPDIPWTGTFVQSIVNNTLQAPSISLQEPSVSSLLSNLGSSLFSLGDGIPILGPLSNQLNQPLPLMDESIAQLTGLDGALPTLPSLPGNFTSLGVGSYPLAGGTLTTDVTAGANGTINQFLHGQAVNLVSWEAKGSVSLLSEDLKIPVYGVDIGIASAELYATFGIDAALHSTTSASAWTAMASGSAPAPRRTRTWGCPSMPRPAWKARSRCWVTRWPMRAETSVSRSPRT